MPLRRRYVNSAFYFTFLLVFKELTLWGMLLTAVYSLSSFQKRSERRSRSRNAPKSSRRSVGQKPLPMQRTGMAQVHQM